jgi:hypothetical protein
VLVIKGMYIDKESNYLSIQSAIQIGFFFSCHLFVRKVVSNLSTLIITNNTILLDNQLTGSIDCLLSTEKNTIA